MIGLDDIKNILISDLRANNVFNSISNITKDVHDPILRNNVIERIVIVIPGGADNGQFERSYPRVCIYIPKIINHTSSNINYHVMNAIRINALENECLNTFRSVVYGTFGNEVYLYKLNEITIENDEETFSNCINCQLKFEVVNTRL